jgi:hypothetical protein
LYILYVTKICILTLLKISYGIGIHLLGLLAVMALITYLKGDKAVFTKKIDKLRRKMYGINI